MMKPKMKAHGHGLLLLAILATLATGCADNGPRYSANTYTEGQVMRSQSVRFARIIHLRYVTIQERNSNPIAGTAIGAIAGGILGSAFGGGSGKTAATVVGAVAGGAIGHEASRNSTNNRQGLELTVRLDSGRVLSVVQAADQNFYVGQQVKVIRSGQTTRIQSL